MSLIESLRSQVLEKESEHAARIAEREAQEAYYQKSLKPAMLSTLTYFSEVVSNLRFLETTSTVELPVSPDTESTVTLEQGNYELLHDDIKNPVCLEIIGECSLVSPQRFHLSTPEQVAHYTEFLDSIQFSYHRKTQLDSFYEIKSATFDLEGPMKVGIRVEASATNRCVYIYLRNLEGMSTRRYQFAPERINSDLLDRLAKLLLRQESKLVKVEVCSNMRSVLREQVEAEKLERDADIARAMQEMLLERQAEADAKKLSTKLLNFTSTLKAGLTNTA
ncbi:MAG: hypothetical protein ABJ013_04175 [Halioglobus sp.]